MKTPLSLCSRPIQKSLPIRRNTLCDMASVQPATSSKASRNDSNKCHASSNRCHASSNRCLTSSNKKLLETSALLLVTIRASQTATKQPIGMASP